jgi:fumarate hydratase class II
MFKSLLKSSKSICFQNFKKFTDCKSTTYRVEHDTFGPINVPTDKYWAAQTQRSIQNFAIGTKEDKMPLSVVKSMAIVKKCAAKVRIENKLG